MISSHSRGIMLNTLVHNFPNDEGSQWALHNASDVYDPLRHIWYDLITSKG